MFKHTPGPWVLGKDNTGSKKRIVWSDDGSQIVAKCEWGNALGNEQANARLISAAPDMLLALMRLYQVVHHGEPLEFEKVAMDAARSAIEKGTGHGCS